jgi:hypothetical protein
LEQLIATDLASTQEVGDAPQRIVRRLQTPLEGLTDAPGQKIFRCPVCADSETRENMVRIIGEYIEEQAPKSLDETLGKIARETR